MRTRSILSTAVMLALAACIATPQPAAAETAPPGTVSATVIAAPANPLVAAPAIASVMATDTASIGRDSVVSVHADTRHVAHSTIGRHTRANAAARASLARKLSHLQRVNGSQFVTPDASAIFMVSDRRDTLATRATTPRTHYERSRFRRSNRANTITSRSPASLRSRLI